MNTKTLAFLFTRDLNRLKSEIELYQSEKHLWLVDKMITNSGGNLCLHLIGNLNAYIGAGLAQTGYIRQRELEFSAKDIPRVTLKAQIEETIRVVERGLDTLTSEMLTGDFPIVIWDKPANMEFTLLHLHSHLNYHLGQINYHRRMLDES
ncbi:MAG: DUF1572 family protein [Saprospiraceae bacterium]